MTQKIPYAKIKDFKNLGVLIIFKQGSYENLSVKNFCDFCG